MSHISIKYLSINYYSSTYLISSTKGMMIGFKLIYYLTTRGAQKNIKLLFIILWINISIKPLLLGRLVKWLFFYKKNHYAPVSQIIWCNRACNIFPLIHALMWPESSPHQDSNLDPSMRGRRLTNWVTLPLW